MTDILYIIFRIIRRHVPSALIEYLLENNLYISSGIETSQPKKALDRYEKILEAYKKDFKGKNILCFGFGGKVDMTLLLLQNQINQIYLYDKYISSDYQKVLLTYASKFKQVSLFTGNIEQFRAKITNKIDICLSSSVLEHINRKELEYDVKQLALKTAKHGIHIHCIDLRDHFFTYPFNMLKYSDEFWNNTLNPHPPFYLNRLRLHDYLKIFKKHFTDVNFHISESKMDKFITIKNRIKKKFLSGNDNIDAITQIALVALYPIL